MDTSSGIKINKYQLPANIRQEIRSCIAVWVLSTMYKMNKMTTRMIFEKMFSMYHGTTDIYSHGDQLLKASGPYETMFEKRIGTVCTSTPTSAVSLVLNKQMFLLEVDCLFGKHIIYIRYRIHTMLLQLNAHIICKLMNIVTDYQNAA